jgi:hypothetical protein
MIGHTWAEMNDYSFITHGAGRGTRRWSAAHTGGEKRGKEIGAPDPLCTPFVSNLQIKNVRGIER